MRQVKAVDKMARGRQGADSAEDLPAAGICGVVEKGPRITEVTEAQGLLLITAFPSLLELVC
jgi:hypothetical protein